MEHFVPLRDPQIRLPIGTEHSGGYILELVSPPVVVAALACTDHTVLEVVLDQCGDPIVVGHVLTILREHFRCNRLMPHVSSLQTLQWRIGAGQILGHHPVQSSTLQEAGVQF